MFLGCDGEGKLQASDCRIVMDTGAEVLPWGGPVFARGDGARQAGLTGCPMPAFPVQWFIPTTCKRRLPAYWACGIWQNGTALMNWLKSLALILVSFRLKNAVRRGDATPAGVVLSTSTGLTPCLERVQQHPLWQEREQWCQGAPPRNGAGFGLAAMYHGIGFAPQLRTMPMPNWK